MARRKRGRPPKDESFDLSEKINFWGELKDETKHSVKGIIYLLFTLILVMAALHKGGVAGEMVFKSLSYAFGIGYFIIPALLVAFSISAFRGENKRMALPQTLGAIVFFLSALGLIHIFSVDRGGVVGAFIGNPLLRVFDIYVSVIILVALLVISFFIIFDTTLRLGFLFSFWRKRKEQEEQEPTITLSVEPQEESGRFEEGGVDEEENEREEKRKRLTHAQEFIASMPRTLFAKEFVPPPLSLLERDRGKPGVGDVKANANIIKRTLENFGIAVEMDEVSIGPSVTRYALKPAEGVKLSRIVGLQNNLELALAAHPVRIEAPIPGKSLVGIEVPNTAKTTIGLGSLLSEDNFIHSDKPLLAALGKDISGVSHFVNVGKLPHLLIAGATGSGKSVMIHAIITSLLYRNPPENLKLIMIDPKRVELTLYNSIPHLLTPVITDAKKAILALKWAAKEMERRYDILQGHGARDIDSYHKNILGPAIEKARKKKREDDEEAGPDPMPFIIIVIDELADIMESYPRELEAAVVRLAQMSRAVGIHLILSTQRPSVNVITGLIKANIPSRIALQVASQVDSRTILDAAGAEKLLGAGDMLYVSGDMGKPVRLQSAYITEHEVKKVSKCLRDSYEPTLSEISFSETRGEGNIFSTNLERDTEDDLYEEARETVIQAGKASTSFLQRKLGVGYARAARLMDMLEERGVVGPGFGAKPREVLITPGGAIAENVNANENEGDESAEKI